MQPWQIKALELEVATLKELDGFIHEHALYFFIGGTYLLLTLGIGLILLFSRGRKSAKGKPTHYARPVIFIYVSGPPPPPPPPETFDPFPPPHHYRHCDHDDDRWD